jgi:fatty-acid desaturase
MHGRRWWELDLSYQSIRALELAGLASNVVPPGRLTLDDSDQLRASARLPVR